MMLGSLLAIVGIGGVLYVATTNKKENVLPKDNTKFISSNTDSNGEQSRLNILKERYAEAYIEIETLYNNSIFSNRGNHYGNLSENGRLNTEIYGNLEEILVVYLNKGTITKEDEKTKKLLNFLDLLLSQQVKIVQLNKVLDMYTESTIPLDVLKEINVIIDSLLQEYVVLNNKITIESKERAFDLLNAIKNNELNDKNSKSNLDIRLSEDTYDVGSIGKTTTNLKSLMDEEDWKD